MDLFIDRDILIRALGRVQGIVERRTPNPVLSHVLLSADGETLRVTATDTMITVVGTYAARVEAAGELSVDAQGLFQIARSLPEPVVHLRAASGNRMEVHCGRSRFNVVGTSSDEFPPLPPRDSDAPLEVTCAALRRILDETVFSVSADENRYGLNGAHLEEVTGEGGQARLRIVTTDGNRLSWSEAPYTGRFGMGRKMLLPRKVLGEVRRLCGEVDTDWSIAFGERTATLSTAGLTMMARLVDGEFPDYRRVLPASWKRRVMVAATPFSDALKRVSIVASDRNHSVRLSLETDGLVLSAANVDLGDVREEVPAELDGAPVSTGFNARYFLDLLGATGAERIVLEMGEALDACIVRVPDRDDCTFVVMPMRLD